MTEAIISVKRGYIEEIPNSYFFCLSNHFQLGQEMQLMEDGGILYTNLETDGVRIRVADLFPYSAVVFLRVGLHPDMTKIPGTEIVNLWYGVVVQLTSERIVIEQARSPQQACERSASLYAQKKCEGCQS